METKFRVRYLGVIMHDDPVKVIIESAPSISSKDGETVRICEEYPITDQPLADWLNALLGSPLLDTDEQWGATQHPEADYAINPDSLAELVRSATNATADWVRANTPLPHLFTDAEYEQIAAQLQERLPDLAWVLNRAEKVGGYITFKP